MKLNIVILKICGYIISLCLPTCFALAAYLFTGKIHIAYSIFGGVFSFALLILIAIEILEKRIKNI